MSENPPEADLYITGSDQVWNPLKIDDAYFLRFVPEHGIRASYAASMGISYIPEGSEQLFREYVEDMDYVSVRESTAKNLIEKYTYAQANVHIDPVLLLTQEHWKKIGFILCYILYRPQWLNQWLKKLHKATGMDIVAVTTDAYRNLYYNRVIRDAGPLDLLGLIRDAQFVVSSSFHGVALSIAMRKPFYAVVNPNAPSRIGDLLHSLQLNDRVIDETDKASIRDIDYTLAEKLLEELKGEAFKYLKFLLYQAEKKEGKNKEIQMKKGDITQVGNKCTACKACVNICPVNAIHFKTDEEGFAYPVIDEQKCIHCSKCVNKCHAIVKISNSKERSEAFYGWHKNQEIRRQSSSGGIFSAMSQWFLDRGGVVIGACYDPDKKGVFHMSSDNVEIGRFRRSKYVESDLGDTYTYIDAALKRDRYVLFCGTPCQCSGIRRVFGDVNKLILCDFFCHGVPSKRLFSDYIAYKEERRKESITDLAFRTKYYGWSQYGMDIKYKNYMEHTVGRCEWFFVASMLDNLFLRKSCYTCDKAMYHESDLTIGDFWGIVSYKPELNDNRGISVILSNSEKGKNLIQDIYKEVCLYPLEKGYLDYAFRVKTADKVLEKRDRIFKEYLRIGRDAFVKKYYRKRLLISKAVFNCKKHKFQQS